MKRVPLLSLLKSRFPGIPGEELYARVMCGEVSVSGERVADPKQLVPAGADLSFQKKRFVSRGGEKLDAALDALGIDVRGLVFIDAGSSTGGFTDVLLSRGAAAVHAVDVGYNQLAYALRNDPRVHVHEKTNIMDVRVLDPPPDAAVADLSFRSLRGAAAHILSLTGRRWALVLFKPQFEYPDSGDGFDGLVGDDDERERLLVSLEADLLLEGVRVEARADSPIAGKKKGNRETILLIKPSSE